jgi:hypothetical protein
MKVPITSDVSVDLDDQDAECLRKMLLIPGAHLIVDKYGYAVYVAGRMYQKVHRLVGYWAGLPNVPTVDHRDTVKLNCRRGNLRPATKGQQVMNRGPNKRKIPGPKGVWKDGNGYRVQCSCSGVTRRRRCKTEKEGIEQYNQWRLSCMAILPGLTIRLARRLISAWRAD